MSYIGAGKLNGGKSAATVIYRIFLTDLQSSLYCIGNGERPFPQREAYFFKSYYFSSVKILQTAVECIRQANSERDEMSFITIHFGGKHSSSLALN